MEKTGRYMAMTIPPQTPPRKTIMIGSINLGQTFDGSVDLFIVELRYLCQHRIQCTGGFTHGDHSDHHAGKDAGFHERFRYGSAFRNCGSSIHDGRFDDDIARCLGRDFQGVQYRHTTGYHGAQSGAKPGDCDFSQQASRSPAIFKATRSIMYLPLLVL